MTGPNTDPIAQGHTILEQVKVQLRHEVYMREADETVMMAAVASGRDILLDSTWGVGKTTLAKALARTIMGTHGRLQGTPDLEARDVTGSYVIDQQSGRPVFEPGPIFANVVLVDEIHRVPQKQQSGLIEGMAEGQVTTTRGETFELPTPQILIGTQNPDGEELRSVIKDRFGVVVAVEPYVAADRKKIRAITEAKQMAQPVTSLEHLAAMQEALVNDSDTSKVEDFADYLIDTLYLDPRVDADYSIVGGMRGSQDLLAIAKGIAMQRGDNGSPIVTPADIINAAPYTLGHRTVLHHNHAKNKTPQQVISAIAIELFEQGRRRAQEARRS
jgi:MoxR-like ATPase